MTFDSLSLSPATLDVIRELGFTNMTPIQTECIPALLKGRDVTGQSQTGSGKTAAFAIPLLEKIDSGRNRKLQALILSPTRELCAQVAREVRKFGRKRTGLQVLAVSGGQPLAPQARALSKGVHVVVGTPGRIIDHLSRGTLDLSQIAWVVLDEADRMVDMGFREDIDRILSAVPEERQTAMFSATFPREIEQISRSYQRNPLKIEITAEETTAAQITQVLYEVEANDKSKALVQLLKANPAEASIVFCNQKVTVSEIARTLQLADISTASLHGDLEQYDRDQILARFRNKSIRVLVATDVAARGLDVENLEVVYNYDLPVTPEVYVHRIGRTGRAGKSGLAVTLVTSRQTEKLAVIRDATGVALERRELPSASQVPTGQELAAASMVTLQINGGRKDKVRPGDILGALTGDAGRLSGAEVGKIEIHDHYAYVAVAAKVADLALKRLNEGQIKGRRFRVRRV